MHAMTMGMHANLPCMNSWSKPTHRPVSVDAVFGCERFSVGVAVQSLTLVDSAELGVPCLVSA